MPELPKILIPVIAIAAILIVGAGILYYLYLKGKASDSFQTQVEGMGNAEGIQSIAQFDPRNSVVNSNPLPAEEKGMSKPFRSLTYFMGRRVTGRSVTSPIAEEHPSQDGEGVYGKDSTGQECNPVQVTIGA